MNQLENHLRRIFSPTMIGFIITGYILLVGIILFREEINLVLDAFNASAIAGEQTSSIASAPRPSSPPVQHSVEPNPTYEAYINEILNDPKNFSVQSEPIPLGRAILEGKTTKFLIGF